MNHYLSSSTAWYIRTNIPHGMQFFDREAMTFDTDNDFDTKNARAAAYTRFSAGATDFRGVFATPASLKVSQPPGSGLAVGKRKGRDLTNQFLATRPAFFRCLNIF